MPGRNVHLSPDGPGSGRPAKLILWRLGWIVGLDDLEALLPNSELQDAIGAVLFVLGTEGSAEELVAVDKDVRLAGELAAALVEGIHRQGTASAADRELDDNLGEV